MDMATQGDDKVVTWGETNQTNSKPVMRISTDNEMTFGQILKLGVNGTITDQ